MIILEVNINKKLDDGLLGKETSSLHIRNPIKPDTIILDAETKKVLVVFGRFTENKSIVKSFLPSLHYSRKSRLTQMKNDYEKEGNLSIQFGFKPQRPVFQHPASACQLNLIHPTEYKRLADLGVEMMNLYKQYNIENYTRQAELLNQIGDHWKIPGTFFTQGIINDSVNFAYHYDRGNIKACWSCMAVFKEEVSGGELIIPAINSSLLVEDNTYVLFDGQSLLHGVAPIKKRTKFGRRFSIVYYAIESMKNCGTYEEEIKKMRKTDMNKHNKKVAK
jgi:hypothetical protein